MSHRQKQQGISSLTQCISSASFAFKVAFREEIKQSTIPIHNKVFKTWKNVPLKCNSPLS